MRRTRILLASVSVLASIAAFLACSGGSGVTTHDAGTDRAAGDAGCQAFVSTADLTQPAVSLSSDVIPVFQRSCGIGGSTCHGARSVVAGSPPRPFLGFLDGGTDAAEVAKGIVGVKASENPAMDLVAPSDPTHSFMMHKLDNDQCLFADDCAKANVGYPTCGVSMPQSSPLLDEDAGRDAIRRWIAQGAKQN